MEDPSSDGSDTEGSLRDFLVSDSEPLTEHDDEDVYQIPLVPRCRTRRPVDYYVDDRFERVLADDYLSSSSEQSDLDSDTDSDYVYESANSGDECVTDAETPAEV